MKSDSLRTLSGNKYFLLRGFPDTNLICAFTTRLAENMSLFYGDTANSLENRKNFLQELDIDYRDLVCAKQIHASKVKYVQGPDKGKGALSYDNSIPDTDALITDEPGLPLAIFTADCLSIFLYDPETPAIGLVHAGWRSTKEKIVAGALQAMKKRFSTRIKDIYVGFGPAIRECCYEVSVEFAVFFPQCLVKREGRYYLDLAAINKKQVLGLGVREENIFDAGICTSCRRQDFYSFRKEGIGCGRLMSVIMLKG